MNTLTTWLAATIAASAMTGTAIAQPAAPQEVVSAAQIEAATTASDHEAIALRYQEAATTAEARAQAHARMAATYRGGTYKAQQRAMTGHCLRLEKAYRAEAMAYRALAAEHRKLAAGAR